MRSLEQIPQDNSFALAQTDSFGWDKRMFLCIIFIWFFFFKIEKQLILLNECSVAMTSLQTNTKPSSTFSLGVDLVFKHVFDHLDSLSFPILWISSNIPQSDRYIGLELLTTSEGYSCIHSSPHSRPLPAVPTNSLWLQHQASATCNSRQQICPKESLSLWD